jgi:hypothetical protein
MADRPGNVEGADRIRLALELYAAGEALMRQRLRRILPDADEDAIEQRILSWLAHRPGAEAGDAAGRRGTWPRAAR